MVVSRTEIMRSTCWVKIISGIILSFPDVHYSLDGKLFDIRTFARRGRRRKRH